MEIKDNSLFYCNLELTEKNKELIETLENYSEEKSKQVYVINKALGAHIEYDYELSDIAIILIPKHSICVVNYGEKTMRI